MTQTTVKIKICQLFTSKRSKEAIFIQIFNETGETSKQPDGRHFKTTITMTSSFQMTTVQGLGGSKIISGARRVKSV